MDPGISQQRPAPAEDSTARAFFDHSSAQRVNTDAVIANSLRKQYPNLELVIVPLYGGVDLLGFAASGQASFVPIEDDAPHDPNSAPTSLTWTMYLPPARRLDGGMGAIAEQFNFGKFAYTWKGTEFLLYSALGSNSQYPPSVPNQYILTPDRLRAEALVLEAGRWAEDVHGQVLVFDGGYWQKSAELYRSVMGASWDAVIMDEGMKKAIIEDHDGFFSSRDTYAGLKVPWKRGLIYHGPPGNGKTISIKATMHMLYARKEPVPTLYVRTLASFAGPEYSIKQIFSRARHYAPCYLVFEDLDSIVSDNVRSYFLNEVDGLKSNDGIFMVGSTNHLELLDPGISKRPSRFDRKYYFPDPDLAQRVSYCRFWQRKLRDNKEDIAFPDALCPAVAGITDGFSFAYIQEAFVAALLSIARRRGGDDDDDDYPSGSKSGGRKSDGFGDGDDNDEDDDWVDVVPYRPAANRSNRQESKKNGGGDDDDGDLEKLVLWREIKKQVKVLREGMED